MKVNSLNLFNYYNNSFKGAQPKIQQGQMTEGASSPVQSTTTGTIGALDAAGTTALASIRAQEEKRDYDTIRSTLKYANEDIKQVSSLTSSINKLVQAEADETVNKFQEKEDDLLRLYCRAWNAFEGTGSIGTVVFRNEYSSAPQTIEEHSQDGKVIRRYNFDKQDGHEFLHIEDGIEQTYGVEKVAQDIYYRDGLILKYQQGVQKFKNGDKSADRVIRLNNGLISWYGNNLQIKKDGTQTMSQYCELENGMLSKYMENWTTSKDGTTEFSLRCDFENGTALRYMENYKSYKNGTQKINKDINFADGTILRYQKDYENHRGGSKTAQDIAYTNAKPVRIEFTDPITGNTKYFKHIENNWQEITQ